MSGTVYVSVRECVRQCQRESVCQCQGVCTPVSRSVYVSAIVRECVRQCHCQGVCPSLSGSVYVSARESVRQCRRKVCANPCACMRKTRHQYQLKCQ